MYVLGIGSELRSWLLFYSLPVLFNILPTPYYDHLVLLVSSIYTLTSDWITAQNLSAAETSLKKFNMQYMELYGVL